MVSTTALFVWNEEACMVLSHMACNIVKSLFSVCPIHICTAPVAIKRFGGGDGPIHLDEVQCTGSESSVLQCPQNEIGNHNCTHLEDAGVRCLTGEYCYVLAGAYERRSRDFTTHKLLVLERKGVILNTGL